MRPGSSRSATQVYETAIGADGRTLFVTHFTAETVSSWQVGSPEAPRKIADGWPASLAVAPGGDVVAMTALDGFHQGGSGDRPLVRR